MLALTSAARNCTGSGLLNVMPLPASSVCRERSISRKSARSLIAAASKWVLTMSTKSGGRLESAAVGDNPVSAPAMVRQRAIFLHLVQLAGRHLRERIFLPCLDQSKREGMGGILTPSLNSNSAAALAGLLRIVVVQMAEADLSKSLRVIFIFLVSRVSCLPSALVCAWRQFPSNHRHPQGAWIWCALP